VRSTNRKPPAAARHIPDGPRSSAASPSLGLHSHFWRKERPFPSDLPPSEETNRRSLVFRLTKKGENILCKASNKYSLLTADWPPKFLVESFRLLVTVRLPTLLRAARHHLLQGVAVGGASTRLWRRHDGRQETLTGLGSVLLRVPFVCRKFKHWLLKHKSAPSPTRRAVKDEQRGGDGGEARPHSRERRSR